MFGAKQTKSALVTLTISITYLSFGGGGGNPPPPTRLECNDPNLILSNKKHPNPLIEEYRPSLDIKNGINNVFYAVQEGRISKEMVAENGQMVERTFAEFPKYAWFPRNDGYDVSTFFQRYDYVDICGNYAGSCCAPVTFIQERTKFVLVKKWVRLEDFCHELKHPGNGANVEQKILEQLQSENLYGFLRPKGLPDNLVFLDKYTPYVYRSSQIPNEPWMTIYDDNGNPVVKSSGRQSSLYTEDTSVQSLEYNRFENASPYSTYRELSPPPDTEHYRLPDLDTPPPTTIPQTNPTTTTPPPVQVDSIPLTEPTPPPSTKVTPTTQYVPPTPNSTTVPSESKTTTPPPPPNPSTTAQKQNPTPPKNTTTGDEPVVAKKVPNQAGMVYSPYVGNGSVSIINVEGLRSGQKAQDPFTGKIFIVP